MFIEWEVCVCKCVWKGLKPILLDEIIRASAFIAVCLILCALQVSFMRKCSVVGTHLFTPLDNRMLLHCKAVGRCPLPITCWPWDKDGKVQARIGLLLQTGAMGSLILKVLWTGRGHEWQPVKITLNIHPCFSIWSSNILWLTKRKDFFSLDGSWEKMGSHLRTESSFYKW